MSVVVRRDFHVYTVYRMQPPRGRTMQAHQGEAMSDYRDGYNQGWADAIQFIRAGGVVPEGLCVPSCEHPHGTCLCNVREGK